MQLENTFKQEQNVKIEVIRVLVADDHEMVLDIARLYLDQQNDMVVTTATSAHEAMEVFKTKGPFDIVLLDYQMPGMNGLNGLAEMLRLSGSVPVAIITGHSSRELMDAVISAGGAGLISKAQPIKSLANSIRFIHSGEVYMPIDLVNERPAAELNSRGPLTNREMTVLKFLGEGKKNRQIANALGLSEGTVKMHVMSICKKLKATNRTHAVILARDTGLL